MKKFFLCFAILFSGEKILAQCYSVAPIPYEPDSFQLGTDIILGSDDSWSSIQQIGFPFCFYGNMYTELLVGANGILTFDTTLANGYCQWPVTSAIPSNSDPMNSIMLAWQDLLPAAGGHIRMAMYGTAPNRRSVISYDSVLMYSCTNLLFTGEAILYESSGVIDMYIHEKHTCAWNGGYAIQGIQNSVGTDGTVVQGRNYPTVWTASDEAWRFTPNCWCAAGIHVSENENVIHTYPTPAYDELHFSFNTKGDGYVARLYDVDGNVLRTESLQANTDHAWNISDLAEGMYLLMIRDDKGEMIAMEKVLKY